MKQYNTMSLAWKLFKESRTIKCFSYCLRLAWNILRKCSIRDLGSTLEYTLDKSLRKVSFAVECIREGRVITIQNDEYHMNLLNYELSYQ